MSRGVLAVMDAAIQRAADDAKQYKFADKDGAELKKASATVERMAEAIDGLKFDVYELVTSELRAAFGGKKAIVVVDIESVRPMKDALAAFRGEQV